METCKTHKVPLFYLMIAAANEQITDEPVIRYLPQVQTRAMTGICLICCMESPCPDCDGKGSYTDIQGNNQPCDLCDQTGITIRKEYMHKLHAMLCDG